MEFFNKFIFGSLIIILMHILIVASGRIGKKPFYRNIIKKADKVIAADGGADNCIKLGINPDYVIGDFDSISAKARNRFKNVMVHDKNQDTTDMEKAMALAKKLECTKLTVIGAIGSRIDHTISNIINLSKAKVHAEIFDEANSIFMVDGQIELTGKKDDIVSVIPVSKVTGLTYKGLKWGLKDKNIEAGWIGVSNRMTGNKASIRLKSGKVIVIKSRD